MSETMTLEQVLADAKGELPVLKKAGPGGIAIADRLAEFVTLVERSAHDYLTFVEEADAMIRADKSKVWFRDRFAEWERQGNARWALTGSRRRQYRLCIVPVAARRSTAISDATRAARGGS